MPGPIGLQLTYVDNHCMPYGKVLCHTTWLLRWYATGAYPGVGVGVGVGGGGGRGGRTTPARPLYLTTACHLHIVFTSTNLDFYILEWKKIDTIFNHAPGPSRSTLRRWHASPPPPQPITPPPPLVCATSAFLKRFQGQCLDLSSYFPANPLHAPNSWPDLTNTETGGGES